MKKLGLFLLIALGLFFTIGGLFFMQFNLIAFFLFPFGAFGVVLLVWANVIWKKQNKQKVK